MDDLIRLRFKPNIHNPFPEDVNRITGLAIRRGYALSDEDAILAWEHHSESVCAGWLQLPQDDDELWSIIFDLVTPF
jgi:hypothetical protein